MDSVHTYLFNFSKISNDLDQPLSKDILNQLAVEDALAVDFYQLSLNAMTAAHKYICY
jgi:hypothetical protein